MDTTLAMDYLIWIAVVVCLATLLRFWHAGSPQRLLCPPFALLLFILAKFMRTRVVALGVR